MKKLYFSFLVLFIYNTTPLLAQEYLGFAKDKLEESAAQYHLSSNDVANYHLNDYNLSRRSQVAHFYFQQQHKGILIHNAIASIHVSPDGTLLKINNQFEAKLEKRITAEIPIIRASQAIQILATEYGYNSTRELEILRPEIGEDRSGVFKNEDYSLRDIPVRLMYQPVEDGSIRLAWDLSVLETTNKNWWSVRIDAITGQILHRDNWMLSCTVETTKKHTCGATHHHAKEATSSIDEICIDKNAKSTSALAGVYNVYPYPVESPNHGVRSLVSNPDNATASPFGWHDTDGAAGAEFTTTRGNNVHAYEDGDNQGFSPDGGAALVFDFPINTTYSTGDQSEAAAVTNLFYWANIFHDMWYQYGFDEASGNFQQNNYGNGGAGNDHLLAEAQDGSGDCNANMGTPPDGSSPTTQMYVCNDRDGDYDNAVIAHEYGHGFSIRLTGGASNAGCLNNQEQMGEGWSDYFGMMMTIELGDTGADKRGMGTWLFGEPADGDGIRPRPYSTDMTINDLTYNNISGVSVPHGVGSVWCTMLWDMTWALIDQYGFDTDFYTGTGGNNIAMALVTEGMKLQPCNPGFVDGRDAILAADQALYGGANQCLIWEAFAKRGLGINADQGSSQSVTDGTESFDSPSLNLEKTVDVSTAGPGTTITYTLTVTNPPLCGITYTDVVVTDDVPTYTTYTPNSASDGGTEAGGIVTFPAVTTIAPGGTFSRSFSVTVDGNAPVDLYNIIDDVEAGTANWTTSNSGGSSWNVNTSNPYAGANAWFAADVGSSSAAFLQVAQPVVPDASTQLSFWHSYDTEVTWDGGVVQASLDNGSTWEDLGSKMIQNGYTSTINNNTSTPAFSGNSGGYVNTIINLSDYAGQTILVRFWMHCDGSVAGNGWFIDDISLTRLFTSIPNTATLTALDGTDVVTASDDLDNPTILVPASCADGVLNGDETELDCGGAICPSCPPSCTDGIQNGDETGLDCGGANCPACPPTCDDGILNQDETGIDCGGAICPVCPTCDDGIRNQGEEAIDCGGPCPACPTCDDGIQNQGEEGIDCGGPCPTCPTCDDGIRNQDETGVDCGGTICNTCNCTDNGLTMALTLDNWPQETSWELRDAATNIIDSGGTYGNIPDGTTLNIQMCAPDGCYDFIIYDSYGDGICCAWGQGSYELVRDADALVLASGGEFAAADTTNFCLESAVACINSVNLTGTVLSDTYKASIYISSDGIVQDGSNVTFQAGEYLDLLPGFEVELNAEFLGTIAPCVPSTNATVSNHSAASSKQAKRLIAFDINPISDKASIQYKLKETTFVKLYIQNMQGQIVHRIGQQVQQAGKYQHQLDTHTLARGIYHLILEKENGERVIEKIIIK